MRLRANAKRLISIWDRLGAALTTGAAGLLVATHPTPSIDALIGGYPATLILGSVLFAGAVTNLFGLLRPTSLLQPIGLLMQFFPLLLLAAGLFKLATASALAVALLILSLALRVVHQYRLLKTRDAIVVAAVSGTPVVRRRRG